MKYTIELTKAELEVVGRALGQRPYVEVAALLAGIDQQINRQEKARAAADAAVAAAATVTERS